MESAENKDKLPNTDPQSLSKGEAIELLNASIDRLEATIKNISNSGKKLPSSETIDTLIETTKELADAVAVTPSESKTPSNPETKTEEVAESAVEKQVVPPQTTTTPPAPVTPAKKKVLERGKVAPQAKPEPQKQENRALTIIGIVAIAMAIVALIWLWLAPTATMTSTSLEPVTEIVDSRDPTMTPLVDKTSENFQNTQLPVTTNIPQDLESSAPETEIAVDTSIPLELTSPGKTQNLRISTIEPELTFTPEQTLVADLQTKLAESIASYDQDLFDQIEIDDAQNSLLVEVTDNWYELSESRQIKLANQILNRSRQLQFSKLELQDTTGTLVARNPVIGEQIIIVQSHKE